MSTIRGFIYEDEFAKAKRVETKRGRIIVPFILIPTPNSEYSDYIVKENVSMDEAEAGKEGVKLGNASITIKRPGMKHTEAPEGL